MQKSFLHIVLGNDYDSYENALLVTELESLKARRLQLCSNFALKALKDDKHSHWFVQSDNSGPKTRRPKQKLKQPLFKLRRFQNSPIPYLTRLINTGLDTYNWTHVPCIVNYDKRLHGYLNILLYYFVKYLKSTCLSLQLNKPLIYKLCQYGYQKNRIDQTNWSRLCKIISQEQNIK